MSEQLTHILTKISIQHLNLLFLLGLVLFGGTVGGYLFQKLRIPQVVGYITIGILIGQSGFKLISQDMINILQPFNYFALGLIGFIIGGELDKEAIVKYGKQFINILLFEGVTAFIMVSVLVGVVGGLLTGDWIFSIMLGLLLGAIASATAPAATTAVLQEYKTKGPLTKTVLGIVALDDSLALLLFAFASSIVGGLNVNTSRSILETLSYPIYKIFGAIIIGVLAGVVLVKFLKRYFEEAVLLTFSIGLVLLIIGIANIIEVDMLLATMTLGVVLTNFAPHRSKETFKLVRGFLPPLYVLFFVLVGAKLNFQFLTPTIVLLGVVYLIGRSGGKAIGASFGARISGAPKSVQKYLPLCLFSQAGVAIGLSILANHYFPGEIGNAVVVIITTTAFILEIIGPTLVRIAVIKAGEAGLNITEEDIIQRSSAKDFMDKYPPLIYEDMKLKDILRIFSENDNLYYPVVNSKKKLRGIITVEGIKQAILELDISELILSHDFMEPIIASVSSGTPMSEVKEILNKYNIDYLPVVHENDIIEGFIERKQLNKFISTKMIELQKRVDSFE